MIDPHWHKPSAKHWNRRGKKNKKKTRTIIRWRSCIHNRIGKYSTKNIYQKNLQGVLNLFHVALFICNFRATKDKLKIYYGKLYNSCEISANKFVQVLCTSINIPLNVIIICHFVMNDNYENLFDRCYGEIKHKNKHKPKPRWQL